MKLQRVEIKNFRSIEDATIEFDPPCQILIGMNESGKSNILKALDYLHKENIDKDEKRQALPDEEKEINESYINFIFNFEQEDAEELKNKIMSKILASNFYPDSDFEFTGYRKIFGKNHLESIKFIKKINFMKGIKEIKCFFTKFNADVYGKIKKINKNILSGEITIDGESVNVNEYDFINIEDLPKISTEIPENSHEEITEEDITFLFEKNILEIGNQKVLPEIIFWNYHNIKFSKDLDINEFKAEPNKESFVFLRNMFSLAKIDDITKTINTWQQEGNEINRLKKVANDATNFFSTVWKNHSKIKFTLELNNDKINLHIEEKKEGESNQYRFERRSDGFKKSVAFLLTVSAVNKNRKNFILLIDEPETSLHPSAIIDLRDELINISHNNMVVISTHSIHMIDNNFKMIHRHKIVKKENEKTTIISATPSRLFDEEVLYNALGASKFDIIKRNVLLFEGWYDEKLFQTFISYFSEFEKKFCREVTIFHSDSVSKATTKSFNFALAGRNCLIVSDSDEAAEEQQRLHESGKGHGIWKRYLDFPGELKEITGEDFIKNDAIKKTISKTVKYFNERENNNNFSFTENAKAEKLQLSKFDKIKNIMQWVHKNISKDDKNQNYSQRKTVKFITRKIKYLLFENIENKDISDSYTILVKEIAKYFKINSDELDVIKKQPRESSEEEVSDLTDNSHSTPSTPSQPLSS